MDTEDLLSISAFARRVGLAPSALRFYDDCRILPPVRVDGLTGYRFYAPDQEERARLLRGLRAAGLPLAEVSVVLDGSPTAARAVLDRHLGRVESQTRTARSVIATAMRALGNTAGTTEATVGGVELASAIRQVVPAAAVGGDHPELECVLIEIDAGEVRLVATDRYRLSVRVLNPGTIDGGPAQVLVRAADLIEVGGWAARAVEVTIHSGPDGARVCTGSESRSLALVDGSFPSYREVLDALAPAEYRVLLDRSAFRDAIDSLGAVDRITLGCDENQAVIALPGSTASVALTAVAQRGMPWRIGFDPAVLMPALEASVGPDVLLEIAAADRPVLVRSADQGSFTTLVMPVRLEMSPGGQENS